MLSSRFVIVSALLMLTVPPAAQAQQQSQASRIRGTIDSVDGTTLAVTSRDGSHVTLRTPDNLQVSGIVKIALADIKPGAYIGVAAMPQADGSQKALSVHLFPDAMRGTGEGFRPWDLRPNSTMTNATVDQTVESNDGHQLTLKYKGGEKTIIVTPETPIVTYVPDDRSDLKAGAKIIAFVTRNEDGSFTAARISVGKDGLTPPM